MNFKTYECSHCGSKVKTTTNEKYKANSQVLSFAWRKYKETIPENERMTYKEFRKFMALGSRKTKILDDELPYTRTKKAENVTEDGDKELKELLHANLHCYEYFEQPLIDGVPSYTCTSSEYYLDENCSICKFIRDMK